VTRLLLLAALTLAVGASAPSAPAAKPAPKPCKPTKTHKCPQKPVAKKKPAPKKPAPKPAPAPVPSPAPSPAPVSPPAPVPPAPAPAPPSIAIAATVPADDAELVRNGVQAGLAFVAKHGAPASFRYDLVAESDLESMVAYYVKTFGATPERAREIWSFSSALASGERVLVLTSARGWTGSSPLQRQKIVAHELFHVLQNGLLGSANTFPRDQETVPPGGPTWLREGSAELAGYTAIAEAGLGDLAQFRRDRISDMKLGSPGVALESVATQGGAGRNGGAPYSTGYVAVDYLVQQRGFDAIVDFYRQVGQGKTWQAAFESAFGRSIDAFYNEFATYRNTL
jgi:hypothetical protein